MKIYNEQAKKLVTPAEMQDGQIGVIRGWVQNLYIGRIVQKYDTHLVAIGEINDLSFPHGSEITDKDCQIEILPPGTLLQI